MLEKWYQTKAMIEETEKNANLIRQKIGSLDCSRKASLNYASPIHEHGINLEDLKSFNNMSNQVDSIKEDDEATKIIHFSEPYRLVHSESGNFDNNQSNSYKSLRISILSNKSQDFEVNKNKIQLYKLQRTRKMNRLSSLMTSGVLDERKNQSQTIYLRNLFNDLWDESTHELDHLIKKSKNSKKEEKESKVFEYHTRYRTSDNIANFENDKTPKNVLEFDNDQSSERQLKEESDIDINKLDRVIHSIMEIEQNEERFIPQKDFEQKLKKHERILSSEQAHNRQSSSNSNIGINKWDDLNIENFLGDDEQQNTSNQSDDKFGHKLDQQFLHDFNKKFKHENIVDNPEQEYDFADESKTDDNVIYEKGKYSLINDIKIIQDSNEKTDINLLDSSSQNDEEKLDK